MVVLAASRFLLASLEGAQFAQRGIQGVAASSSTEELLMRASAFSRVLCGPATVMRLHVPKCLEVIGCRALYIMAVQFETVM